MPPIPDDLAKVDLRVQVDRLDDDPDVPRIYRNHRHQEEGNNKGEEEEEEWKKKGKNEDGELPALEMLARQSYREAKGEVAAGGQVYCQQYSPASLRDLQSGCCYSPAIGPYLRQVTMAVVACLAGVSVGSIHAFPAVALPRWEEEGFNLTTTQATWFASTPMVVSMVACAGSGVLVECLGTRVVLLLTVPLLGASWLALALSRAFWVMQLARVLQGAVASVCMVALTVYPAEVSVPRWRGMTMCVSEAMVMLGVFLTYVLGLVMPPHVLAYTLAAALLPKAIAFYFLREAPLWLARKDRHEDTARSLACLRGPLVDIRPELQQIQNAVETDRNKPSASEQLLLLRKRVYMKPLLLAITLLLFKELTGQYAAMAYTVKIFQMAGSSLDPYLCAVVMGAARFLPCFLSWTLIDRLPRRLLLSSCLSLSGSSLAVLGVFLWFWADVGVPQELGWVPLVCLLVFTLAFGAGVGTTSWTLVAELLPSQVRNVGAGIINTAFSLFLFLVGLTFPHLAEAFTVGPVFLLYAACSLVGAIFVLTCLPETRGRSFADIQKALGTNAV